MRHILGVDNPWLSSSSLSEISKTIKSLVVDKTCDVEGCIFVSDVDNCGVESVVRSTGIEDMYAHLFADSMPFDAIS